MTGRPRHNKVQTTARYAHLANDPVKSAANLDVTQKTGWPLPARIRRRSRMKPG